MITEQVIKEYKKLYLKHYDIELSNNEANEQAISLLNLFNTIYKPIEYR